jgi:hypothetical protein
MAPLSGIIRVASGGKPPTGFSMLSPLQIYWLTGEIVPLPGGHLKKILADMVPNGVARFLVHRLRGGSFIVADMQRI